MQSAVEGGVDELIVVDGGSTDGTVEIARQFGAHVVHSAPGRGVQLNAGAGAASCPVLLFLHADTLLPPRFVEFVDGALKDNRVVAGAFRLGIDADSMSLRIVERCANLRSRWLGLPYGDQALFMRRQTFDEVGGFPELPMMEDYALVRRLKRAGRIAIVAESVTTSARRWESRGVWRTTLANQMCVLGYSLGISTERLAALR